MKQRSSKQKYSLIVGMGATGISVANYLQRQKIPFCVFDTRPESVLADNFKKLFPNVDLYFLNIDENIIAGAEQLIISPGVSREEDFVKAAVRFGVPVIGDIELFLQGVDKPVIGITGSNGKSTVTSLVGLAAERAGIQAVTGGNIGTPALDLLKFGSELFVLELSSFQLESTVRPNLEVACMLNVSPDHMDRYENFSEYVSAKQRIYWGAQNVVYCLDDELTSPPQASGVTRFGFGRTAKVEQNEIQYCYSSISGYLMREDEKVLHKSELKIRGLHNINNALATLAICEAAEIDINYCIEVLREFNGLPHRCEWVAEQNGLTFINDSKATNVGAAEAALVGLAPEFEGLILIAGGDGKGVDFSAFGEIIGEHVRALIVLGQDGKKIADAVDSPILIDQVDDMEGAVKRAVELGKEGEAILLSPACASFDMFNSYEERGQAFISSVKRVCCE